MRFSEWRFHTHLQVIVGFSFALFIAAILVATTAVSRNVQRLAACVDHDQARVVALGEPYSQGLQMGHALRNILLDPPNPKAYAYLDGVLGKVHATSGKVSNASSQVSATAQTLVQSSSKQAALVNRASNT